MRATVSVGRGLRCVAVAGLLTLSSGCLLHTKTAEGRALHGAPGRLARASAVSLSLTVASQLVHQGSLTSQPAPDPGFSLQGAMDLGSGRAWYVVQGQPVVVFDRNHAYARRPHARPSDARPWVEVTVDRHLNDLVLDPAALSPSLEALVLRPSVLVDAMSGALTGSIDKVGPGEVGGVTTTVYTARFDLNQALYKATRHHYSQHEQDDLAKLLSILGVKSDALNQGRVWIDAQGVPRRLVLALRETPTPQSLLLLRLDLRLTPQDHRVEVDVPASSTVTTVPSIFQYLQPLRSGTAA